MAQNPYDGGVPSVSPDATPPADYRHVETNPNMFGGAIATGLQQLGQGAVKATQFYSQVNAQDATNRTQGNIDGIIHGTGQTVTNPDGTTSVDAGYLGMRGIDAVSAREAILKKIDAEFAKGRSMVQTPEGQLDYDRWTQQYKSYALRVTGQHYDTQFHAYSQDTNKSQAGLELNAISNNAYDDNEFAKRLEGVKQAEVRQAQLEGSGPEGVNLAVQKATQDAWEARLKVISVDHPDQAYKMVQDHQKDLGPAYEPLAQQFRARAEAATGAGAANQELQKAKTQVPATSAKPLPPQIASDPTAMVAHFEGFRDRPYWDVNHWRTGYGSDTITHADGSIETVTAMTGPISREDANRDLARRVKISQNDALSNVGEGAWSKLSPGAQSALTSIAYNYGSLSKVPSVVAAAQSGDANALAAAIKAQSGANGGVNAKRRSQEAAAVLGTFAPTASGIKTAPVAQTYEMPPEASGSAQSQLPPVDAPPPAPQYAPPSPQQPPAPPSPEAIRAAAYQGIDSRTDLNDAEKKHARQSINESIVAEQIAEAATSKDRKERNDKASDGYIKQFISGNVSPDVVREIANDPNLEPSTRLHLGGIAEKYAGGGVAETNSYGKGFWDVFKAVTAPPDDPGRVTDVNQILKRAVPGGDLTLAGAEKLRSIMMQSDKSVDQAHLSGALNAVISGFQKKLSFDEEQLYPGMPPIKDPKGAFAFNTQFVPRVLGEYDKWISEGKNPWDFINDTKHFSEIAEQIRPSRQMAADRLSAGAAMAGEAPNATPQKQQPVPAAPQGVDPKEWQGVVTKPPVSESGKPWPLANWSMALNRLRADPSPENIKIFDTMFEAQGIKAEDILKRLPPNAR